MRVSLDQLSVDADPSELSHEAAGDAAPPADAAASSASHKQPAVHVIGNGRSSSSNLHKVADQPQMTPAIPVDDWGDFLGDEAES